MSRTHKRNYRRGIYILPNLFTISSLLCGFYAAISAIGGKFEYAAIAIIACVVLDSLDGNIARLTNTTSRFGAELDSLTDAIVFGFVPALIAYQWSLYSLADLDWLWNKLGWLVAFFYTATTSLRLARFNAQESVISKPFFRGLPCPAAALLIVSFVWSWEAMGHSGDQIAWLVAILMFVSGIAMVSNFSYFSLKSVQWKSRVSFIVLPFLIMVLVFAMIDIPKFLFLLMLLYLSSGPALYLFRWVKKRVGHTRDSSHTQPPSF